MEDDIAMKDTVLLIDERGKRYLARSDQEMVDVRGLGTVRGELIRASLEDGMLRIGDRTLSVRRATVHDMISAIERGAQILTSKDIAMILHLCDVRCGSNIVEGGAGSGALTIAILANIGKEGHLTTYELREDFGKTARQNVTTAGLLDRWCLKLSDVRDSIDERNIDSVILDIPDPWDCVAGAKTALRAGGTFCAFAPNINQIETTVKALRNHAFGDVRAVETLQRDIIVHDRGTRPSFDMLGHTGYIVTARRSR